jgi:hypothetical protein
VASKARQPKTPRKSVSGGSPDCRFSEGTDLLSVVFSAVSEESKRFGENVVALSSEERQSGLLTFYATNRVIAENLCSLNATIAFITERLAP